MSQKISKILVAIDGSQYVSIFSVHLGLQELYGSLCLQEALQLRLMAEGWIEPRVHPLAIRYRLLDRLVFARSPRRF